MPNIVGMVQCRARVEAAIDLLASGKSLVRLSRDEIHARLDERAKEAEEKHG